MLKTMRDGIGTLASEFPSSSLLVLIASLGGCTVESELPGVAVDSYISWSALEAEDWCVGEYENPSCAAPKALVSIESAKIEPDGVVSLVKRSSLPKSLQLTEDEYLIHVERTGEASLRARVKFGDDSERETELRFEVREVDRVVPSYDCSADGESPKKDFTYLPVGWNRPITAELYAGKTLLRGVVESALSGPGFELASTDYLETVYQWQAPTEPGEVDVSSSVDPEFDLTLHVFAPKEVELVEYPWKRTFRTGETTSPGVWQQVDGAVPCQGVPLTVTTRTPDTCEVDDGMIHLKASGACTYTVSVEGTETSMDFTIESEGEAIQGPVEPDELGG